MQDQNLILISYKNKLLLSSGDSPFEKNAWGFVGEKSKWIKSNYKNAATIVQKVTKLKFSELTRMKLEDPKGFYVYCLKLSDSNVNSIIRNDGQKLEFYTLKEVEKLNLTTSTNSFITNFKNEIVNFLSE